MRKINTDFYDERVEIDLQLYISSKISLLRKLFPSDMSEEQLEIYTDVLSEHFDMHHFQKAFKNVVRTFKPTYGCQYPVIAHFIEACNPEFPGEELKAKIVLNRREKEERIKIEGIGRSLGVTIKSGINCDSAIKSLKTALEKDVDHDG